MPCLAKGGFKSEETGGFLLLQNKYSKSLSWAENLNFLPTSVNNLFKFSAHDSDLEHLFWRSKNPPVSSDLKPPLTTSWIFIYYQISSFTITFYSLNYHSNQTINSQLMPILCK